MRRIIQFGIAAALAVAFAPAARACDTRGYEAEIGQGEPRIGGCATVVSHLGVTDSGYQPVDYDLRDVVPPAALAAGEGPGAGSGEPEALGSAAIASEPQNDPAEARFLDMVWNAP